MKKALRVIKNILKFILPLSVYFNFYQKKHHEEYVELMNSYGAPKEYTTDPLIEKDFFEAFRLYGLPAKYYIELDLFNLKDKRERNKLVPPGRPVSIWKGINSTRSQKVLDNKAMFMERFSAFLHRDWLYVPHASYEEFTAFCNRNPRIIAKSNTGAGGFGIHRFDPSESNDLRSVYQK